MKKELFTLALAPLALSTACTSSNSELEQPNILFIFTDDWGLGDLGCYGNTEVLTPNVDKFASEGTRFTQFHVNAGVSSPSRAAVITGLYPGRNAIHGHLASTEQNQKRGMPNWLSLDNVLLPKLMQQAGYTTAHFGKWHLGGGGAPNGDPNAPMVADYGYDEARVWNGNGLTWKGDQHHDTTRYMDSDTLWMQSSNRIAVDETLDFMKRKKDAGKPMYIDLWIKDPHTPLAPSDEQKDPYKEYPVAKETYYAVLTDADFHIGRLLDELKAMGLEENTLVIFSSDNGPAHYNPGLTAGSTAGLRGRKASIFQGGVVVPFIMRWPGKVDAGKVNESSVISGVDLLPTFCELAGIELPKGYSPDGESFASYFKTNKFDRNKALFWDWRAAIAKKTADDAKWAAAAIREGDFKMVANKAQDRVELYNIVLDPKETTDVSAQNPELTKQLLDKWNAWRGELPE